MVKKRVVLWFLLDAQLGFTSLPIERKDFFSSLKDRLSDMGWVGDDYLDTLGAKSNFVTVEINNLTTVSLFKFRT